MPTDEWFLAKRAEWIEEACEVLHDAYERAAVVHGWDTNPAAKHKPWSEVPESNRQTMRDSVAVLLGFVASRVEEQVTDLNQWPGEFYVDSAHVVREGHGAAL